MGSSKRWQLNHETHSSAASLTASIVSRGHVGKQVCLAEAVDGFEQHVIVATTPSCRRFCNSLAEALGDPQPS